MNLKSKGLLVKITEKYCKMPNAVRASLWFAVSNVLIRGISFITLPIFSRLLLPEEYGVIYVYQTWVGIISIFTTLGLWGGVFKVAIVNFDVSKYKVVSAFQGLSTFVTVVIGTICLSLFRNDMARLLDISDILVVVLFIDILSMVPVIMWKVSEQFDYKYHAVVSLTLVTAIFVPLFSYIGILLFPGNKAEAKIIGGLLPQVIVAAFIFVKNIIRGKVFFDKILWKFGFSFNVVLIPHYLSTLVLGQSDRIMINKICGSADAGLYGMAYTFATLITLISNAIETSLTPHVYKAIKNNDTVKIPQQINGIVFILACLMALMVCFIPDVFMFVLPVTYYDAIWVFPPVITGTFFIFLYSIFGAVEFYYKENKFVTIASCIGAVLNVVLNYYFINIFGYIAAAYTTLICYILFALAHYTFMNVVLKKNRCNYSLFDTRFLMIISSLLVVFSLSMEVLYSNSYARWIAVIMLLILLCNNKEKLNIVMEKIKQ